MNRTQGLFPVLAAIAIQLTLGIAYIWSVFQTGIANSIFGGNNAQALLTFSLLLALLTIGAVIGGKLAFRFSTRIVVFIGGIILSAGFFLTSFVTEAFPQMIWITYGIMGGIGMGFTYSTTIACAQKWYPHKKGFVTGIIVAALGFGGVVFTPIVRELILFFDSDAVERIRRSLSAGGISAREAGEAMRGIGNPGEFGEFNTFIVLSVVFLVVCSFGSLFLKNPPDGHMAGHAALSTPKALKIRDYTPSQMAKTPQFYLVIFTFMLACMGGLMMIGFAKPFAELRGLAETATIGILAITMFNSFGRLFWGAVSDKLGRKNTICILLSGAAILSILVGIVPGLMIYVLIALIGFFYGGLLSNFPSLTADLFGPKHMATNYGVILLGFGAGAVLSSQIAGHFANNAVRENEPALMLPAFVIASGCSLLALVLMLILKALRKKQLAVN